MARIASVLLAILLTLALTDDALARANRGGGPSLWSVLFGACGSAQGQALPVEPTTAGALCSGGTAGLTTGIGPWSWTCSGSLGAPGAQCSAYPTAATTTYYVATTGSPSNPGTFASPFSSIAQAQALAGPGTDIIVRGGTYSPAANIGITASGTPSAYIRIHAYPGETPIIDGTTTAHSAPYMLFYASGNYVEIEGFTIQNGNIDIGTNCANNDHFINNVVTGAYYQGILLGNCNNIGQGGGYNLVRANNVNNNSQESNPVPTTGSAWAEGITSYIETGDIIEGNTAYNNYGEGIGTYEAVGTVFSFNVSYDNFSVQLYVNGVPNAVVNSNITYNTGNTNFYRFGYPAEGIAFAIEANSNGIEFPLNNLTVTNNIVDGGRYAMVYGNYGVGGGIQNSLCANNTIYNGNLYDLYISFDSSSGNIFENNILYTSNSQPVAGGSPTGFTFDYNDWFGTPISGWNGAHDVFGDPLFVSGGGTTATNYKLSAGSPALGAGVVIPGNLTNFANASRTVLPNMGAW